MWQTTSVLWGAVCYNPGHVPQTQIFLNDGPILSFKLFISFESAVERGESCHRNCFRRPKQWKLFVKWERDDVSPFVSQGGLAFASLWGLANPRSRSQGDRRDKRSAYVSPYVHRREGRRRCKASKYGYTLSTGPWVVAHPRSWCQGWDCRSMFRVRKYPVDPAYVSPIWNCRARLAGRRAGSDVAVHPHDSPTND